MQHFTIKPNGFTQIRKKSIGIMVAINSAILLFAVFLFYPNNPSPDSPNTLPYILIGVILIFSFSTWNAMRRQRKIFESFRLIIGDDAIVREQLYTPTITIEKNDVRDIIRYATGQIRIDGGSKLNAIAIPSQIDNADVLSRLLSEIRPISEKTSRSWIPYLILMSALAVIVLMFAGLTRETKIISVFCGIALCIVMLYGFIVIQKSKNVDKRLKRMSYIFLLPFISILSVTIIKLMS
jgi:hypothetical protein